MKKHLHKISLVLALSGFGALQAQTWTLVGTPSATQNIQDIAAKGNTLYVAAYTDGILKSTDGGVNYTSTAVLPNSGMWGTAGATRIRIAKNGDLLVGADDKHSMGVLGAVFYRSSDDGATWNRVIVNGTGGYDDASEMIELDNGTILMKVASNKLFKLAPGDSVWSQVTIPNGGGITMLNSHQDTIFIVTNLTALSYSADNGATWQRYGSNGTIIGNTGSPQETRMLFTPTNKFIGFGGSGIFRSGIHDTTWVSKSSGLPSPAYTLALATDGTKIWISYQEQGSGNTCKSGVSADNGESWTPYPGNTPTNSILPTCLRRIVPMGSDIYSFANKDVYKISNVATPNTSSVAEKDKGQLLMFPNPAKNQMTVIFTGSEASSEIEIVDLNGRVVLNMDFNPAFANTIDVSELSAGIYLLKLRNGNQTITEKFVKE